MFTRNQRRFWLAAVKALKRELPCSHPVLVRVCNVPKDTAADCVLSGGKWRIRIGSYLPYGSRVDSLIHEYAHALDDCMRHRTDEAAHGESWGVCYAKCYRVVLEQRERYAPIFGY